LVAFGAHFFSIFSQTAVSVANFIAWGSMVFVGFPDKPIIDAKVAEKIESK
jgi:hypothetical protein